MGMEVMPSHPTLTPALYHLWQSGQLALGAQEWVSWRPCLLLSAALGRAVPVSCVGSLVELASVEGAQVNCPGGQEWERAGLPLI